MTLEKEGIIIRAVSGFYYVRCGDTTVACRAKGRFRKERATPLVGDRVTVETETEDTGIVSLIHERKNAFVRPSVANVDALVIILSGSIPITDPFLVDRLTVRCEKNHCGVLLAVNKIDLDPALSLREIYKKAPYPVFPVSAATGEGMADFRSALKGKNCCFTGNSGVGKSSILNRLCPELSVPTGEISVKLGRGKHTTRHVELFPIEEDTYIADTPGFASLDDEGETPVRTSELPGLFPEFSEPASYCRFDDCTHRREPGCAVREASETGLIHPSRYSSYLRLYEEAAKIRDWEQK